jgi:hypothetical protein
VYQGQKSIEDFQHNMGTVALPHHSVYEWITMFKNGHTSVTDDERSGHPSTSTTEENTERVCAMILDNQRVTTAEVVYHLHISHGSVHEIIQTVLAFIRCVQDGFPNNSQKTTNATV